MNFILKKLDKIDENQEVEIVAKKDHEFYIEYILSNVEFSQSNLDILSSLLLSSVIQFSPIDGTNKVSLNISKINNLSQNFQLKDFLDANDSKIYLGVGYFGLIDINLDEITHLSIIGTTGMGKSTLIKSLATQILTKRDDVESFFIDIKGTEFGVFKNHPNVGGVIGSAIELQQFIDWLSIEIARREYYFANSFEMGVENLNKYRDEKVKFDIDNTLPNFNKIMVFIDEFILFCSLCTSGSNTSNIGRRELWNNLLSKARAVGIHFVYNYPFSVGTLNSPILDVFSSMTTSRIYFSSNRNYVSKSDRGYINYQNMYSLRGSIRVTDFPIPDEFVFGRFAYDSINGGLVIGQSFFVEQKEISPLLKYHRSKNIKTNIEVEKIEIDRIVFESFYLSSLVLFHNFKYDEIISNSFFEKLKKISNVSFSYNTSSGLLELESGSFTMKSGVYSDNDKFLKYFHILKSDLDTFEIHRKNPCQTSLTPTVDNVMDDLFGKAGSK